MGVHFLKQIDCLEDFAITADAQNISLLLFNKPKSLENTI
jgi:hypothetical protein